MPCDWGGEWEVDLITVEEKPNQCSVPPLDPCRDNHPKPCILTSPEPSKLVNTLLLELPCPFVGSVSHNFYSILRGRSYLMCERELFLFNQTCWDICGHKKDTSSHLGLKNLFEPVDNMDGKQKGPIYHLLQDWPAPSCCIHGHCSWSLVFQGGVDQGLNENDQIFKAK